MDSTLARESDREVAENEIIIEPLERKHSEVLDLAVQMELSSGHIFRDLEVSLFSETELKG